jgi:hypothetical protein
MNHHTYVIFQDAWRRVSGGSIVPDSSKTRRGFSPNLTPRKGHFSSSPWQRHGKTVPQKEDALKGHPNQRSPFQMVAASWGTHAGLDVL